MEGGRDYQKEEEIKDVVGDIRSWRRNMESGMTVLLCLGWHNKEGELMPEQVRLQLPRLQTSAASANLFP